MGDSDDVTFRQREFKGSRLRCLLLTHRERRDVSDFLTAISESKALVDPEQHKWSPGGFLSAKEAKLGESRLLDKTQRETIEAWWLANPKKANTPNWDLVSQANINQQSGLLLVEGKAHRGEFSKDRCGATDPKNLQQIKRRLSEANAAWNSIESGFNLSVDAHYQLSNRFAFAWKLATMKVPVVLVYLGFIDAFEMKPKRIFGSHADWQDCVLKKSKDTVPNSVWGKTFHVDGTPISLLIKSASVRIDATIHA